MRVTPLTVQMGAAIFVGIGSRQFDVTSLCALTLTDLSQSLLIWAITTLTLHMRTINLMLIKTSLFFTYHNISHIL